MILKFRVYGGEKVNANSQFENSPKEVITTQRPASALFKINRNFLKRKIYL